MHSREKYLSVFNFEKKTTLKWEIGYWGGTIFRWYKEGLNKSDRNKKAAAFGKEIDKLIYDNSHLDKMGYGDGVMAEAAVFDDYDFSAFRENEIHDLLGLDKGIYRVPLKNIIFPPFEKKILEEKDNQLLVIEKNGCTVRKFKDNSSIPQIISYPVNSRKDWGKFKEERLSIENIKERFPRKWDLIVKDLKERDYPLYIGGDLAGFFGTIREFVGIENLSYLFFDDPGLIKEINQYLLDLWINIYSEALTEIEADAAMIFEDMSYKYGSLISPEMFREFLTPYYKKLTSFFKSKGINAIFVDTDGDCSGLIPLFLEAGVTGLLPIEGHYENMNVLKLRRNYPELLILGGIDKTVIEKGKDFIDNELENKIFPAIKLGGYIPTFDHLVHPQVSWSDFVYYRNKLNNFIEKNGI